MSNPLFEIGTVIIVATLLAYAARLVKQPMILGYVLSGFVIGPYLAGIITNTETIALLSELGIAFVLFVVGMEIDINKIKKSLSWEPKIKFKEFDVGKDEEARNVMIEKSGQMGVPVIFVGDPSSPSGEPEMVIGFDQGKLKSLLGLG